MMKIYAFLLVLAPYFVFGQETKIPEAVLCTPVLLLTDIGQGSGVFMSDSVNQYFITARHNLFSQEVINTNSKTDTVYKFLPKSGQFIFYPHNVIQDEQCVISIDLKGTFNENLIKFDRSQDIAVVLIGRNHFANDSMMLTEYTRFIQKNKGSYVHSIQTNMVRKYSEINIGADIYLFGYPGSIGLQQKPQFDYLRPLLRKGIIAGKFERNKTIIIDSPSYFGNSGGPVFEIIKDNTGEYVAIFGLITEYIPYIEQWENKNNGAINVQTMNSGYSIVTPIEYALQIINKFK
jgi:hypothetical protein